MKFIMILILTMMLIGQQVVATEVTTDLNSDIAWSEVSREVKVQKIIGRIMLLRMLKIVPISFWEEFGLDMNSETVLDEINSGIDIDMILSAHENMTEQIETKLNETGATLGDSDFLRVMIVVATLRILDYHLVDGILVDENFHDLPLGSELISKIRDRINKIKNIRGDNWYVIPGVGSDFGDDGSLEGVPGYEDGSFLSSGNLIDDISNMFDDYGHGNNWQNVAGVGNSMIWKDVIKVGVGVLIGLFVKQCNSTDDFEYYGSKYGIKVGGKGSNTYNFNFNITVGNIDAGVDVIDSGNDNGADVTDNGNNSGNDNGADVTDNGNDNGADVTDNGNNNGNDNGKEDEKKDNENSNGCGVTKSCQDDKGNECTSGATCHDIGVNPIDDNDGGKGHTGPPTQQELVDLQKRIASLDGKGYIEKNNEPSEEEKSSAYLRILIIQKKRGLLCDQRVGDCNNGNGAYIDSPLQNGNAVINWGNPEIKGK